MKSKIINSHPKTIALICDTGDEIVAALEKTAKKYSLGASHFTAIGALKEVTLGYFDIKKKDYQKRTVKQQCEVLSLIGDLSLNGKKHQIHAHIVVGKKDCSTRGGHLIQGTVCPTLEIILVESPAHLVRRYHPEVGLALIELKSDATGMD